MSGRSWCYYAVQVNNDERASCKCKPYMREFPDGEVEVCVEYRGGFLQVQMTQEQAKQMAFAIMSCTQDMALRSAKQSERLDSVAGADVEKAVAHGS
jgi:hypothetical protein